MERYYLIKLILAALITTTTGCQFQETEQPNYSSYDECVIQNAKHAKTNGTARIIQRSCLGQFPIQFDWQEIADKANMKSWKEVLQGKGFKELAEKEKQEAKNQYWEEVIKPFIRNDFIETAREQFLAIRH
ncbi:hypothetical protein ABGV17_05905 [Guyparkeria sp. GHLCS8-2]|uniref:hypothetical protein n=1 Tax=Guyparkeria halopsychrophila TaxID=3139421 RepID=UPI0037CB4A22